MLHIICALDCEAAPLISHYKLACIKESGKLKSYQNASKDIRLTISGVGKTRITAVIEQLARHTKARNEIWINIGIAGHESFAVGELYLAQSVLDKTSGDLWYPQIVMDTDIPGCDLVSLDSPSKEYSSCLYDMEAAGFYSQATKYSTLERIYSLKVISDNVQQPAGKMDKDTISRIIMDQLPSITLLISQLISLNNETSPELIRDEQLTVFFKRWHFTEYQRHRLKNMIQRWHCLYPEKDPVKYISKSSSDARQIMADLENQMDQAEITF